MISTNLSYLLPELMDVVRLFEGAAALEISHTCSVCGDRFLNTVRIGEREISRSDEAVSSSETEKKSLCKRYAKMTLYTALSEMFGVSLPWGSLTGIRPTRLARQALARGEDFAPLFAQMGVSKENTDLVRRVIEGQEGIYEEREGNCDLYISLPFCPSKCSYCSFITAPVAAMRPYIPAYFEAIKRELGVGKGQIGRLRSVYIGGGTPFVLETAELEEVLEAVSPILKDVGGCEYTVEAGRPDVFTKEKLQLCRDYGVTRICINAQSFSDDTLCAIGRKHTAAQIYEAFSLAEPYGFSVNCDLIAGLTGEKFEGFRRSVDEAISLSPDNITVHTLCLKRGARLKEEHLSLTSGKAAVRPLGGEEVGEMIAYSREALTHAGYEPYYLYRQKYMAGAHENVGWTKHGRACVYNVDVMEEIADNLAVGANAVSKRVLLSKGRIERYGSPKDVPSYLKKLETILEEKEKLFSVRP